MKKILILLSTLVASFVFATQSTHKHSDLCHKFDVLNTNQYYNNSSAYKRVCGRDGTIYDIRFGGCPTCRAPKFGF